MDRGWRVITCIIVRHKFNVRVGKIGLVKKRTNTAPILGRLLENGGSQRYAESRFDGVENGLSYGASFAAMHTPRAK